MFLIVLVRRLRAGNGDLSVSRFGKPGLLPARFIICSSTGSTIVSIRLRKKLATETT
jgi:hypothetical protein